MTTPQAKITNIVEVYRERFPQEYSDFCKMMKDQREFQKDDFASTGTDGAIGQKIREVPLTLDNLMKIKLNVEERMYYNSKLGAEWFARTFKEFSPAIKI
jgi:hypothetical protein